MLNNIFSESDYSKTSYESDYVVIGTGPGGSVAGTLLAESGKEVLFIEEGGYYDTKDYTSNMSDMMLKLFRNGGVLPILGKPTIAFGEGQCVGGGSVINGGAIWSTPPWILEDWENNYGLKGYGFNDLEDHFKTINKDLHVVRDELDTKSNLDSLYLAQSADSLGWKYSMMLRAVNNCVNTNLCGTGCTSGAKQSMLKNYLPRAINAGARIFTNCRAVSIKHNNKRAYELVISVRTKFGDRTIKVKFNNLILSCGAIQTAFLLKRSKLAPNAGKKLELHWNLKMAVRFKDPIYANNGTVTTVQVQEFEKDGTLMMSSPVNSHFLSTNLAHFSNQDINYVLSEKDRYAIYCLMIKPKSKAAILKSIQSPIIINKFDRSDLSLIKKSMRQINKLLFSGGDVSRIYLPIIGMEPIKSLKHFDKQIDKIKISDLNIVSVHAMGSCPMGNSRRNSVVNNDGLLWDIDNVYLSDASVFPSNIGESPQGTIMALSHEIMQRHIYG